MRWLKYGLLTLAGLLAAALVAGWLLPERHTASRSLRLASSPDAVFAAVTDFASYPQWRSDVSQVEVSAGPPGVGTTVREHGANGTVPYRVEAFEPPSKLVMRIDDPTLPFGGTWTYEIFPSDSGTELVITEDGEIHSPVFRLMGRLFFSPYDTIDRYLADLEKRLDQSHR